MQTAAVILDGPRALEVRDLPLVPPGPGDVVVEVGVSGISSGTERLLWTGEMPDFPGMGYPLVPGYEAAGTVVEVWTDEVVSVGDTVFVPGANCFDGVRGLFGAAANHIVTPERRVVKVDAGLGDRAALLALAATAQHALAGGAPPQLIVGHGALGRLLARQTIAAGHPPPTVWEIAPERMAGAAGYEVLHPDTDPTCDYATVYDVSGDAGIVDTVMRKLRHGGEIVLAGFYPGRVGFDFPRAFLREARLRVAAQWSPADMATTRGRIEDGTLSLDGLITHRAPASQAAAAYERAFTDPACLKMMLEWRQ